MAVNYPYYIPQQQQSQYAAIPYAPQQRMPYVEQPQIGIKGRPVSSIEEVKATSIDFDGSVFFFPDLANKKIYTKQINLDGTSTHYCSIVKAMEEKDEEHRKYYIPITPPYYLPDRDMDRNEWGRMYYPRSRDSQGRYTESDRGDMQDSSRNYGDRPIYYNEKEFPMDLRDSREGRSPMIRRMYMESKELHKDKEIKMKELDKYMKELSEDLVEMIDDASPEERQLLEKKISALATKISSLNHV